MENKNKKVPVLTIVAASFTGVNILCYTLFIAAFFFGFGKFPSSALIVAMLGLPAISIVAFILSLRCRREDIKGFWIPNLIVCIALLIASFPASCASCIQGISIDNANRKMERETRLRNEAEEQATIEFVKESMATMKSHYKAYEAAYDYFISMEFTLMDSLPDYLKLAGEPIYRISRSNNECKVTFFEDNTGIQIISQFDDYQYFGGLVRASATRYYSCNQEDAVRFHELLRGDANNEQQSSQPLEQSTSLI